MRKILATNIRAVGEAKPIELQSVDEKSVFKFTVEILTLPGPTRNGVLYPKEDFQKALDDPRIIDMLNRGTLYGEDGHPLDEEDLKRWVEIDKSKASHKWNKLWIEGNKLMGECQTFTGNGNLLAHAIMNGELPAFSIRVIGSPEETGEYITLRDIVLITIDWVNYPGNPTSHMLSTDDIQVEHLPGSNGFSLDERRSLKMASGEASKILGVERNDTIINYGKGLYVVDKLITKDDMNKAYNERLNAFDW